MKNEIEETVAIGKASMRTLDDIRYQLTAFRQILANCDGESYQYCGNLLDGIVNTFNNIDVFKTLE